MKFIFEEEVIADHKVTAETKKLWSIQMEMAQKLLEVCDKYGLKIWACGGTLLGTVRHQGYIPWDDDMDFCMKYDDFKKLLEVGPNEFEDPFFFQSYDTDSFWSEHIKIRKSDTTFVINDLKTWKHKSNEGVFIDVFPLIGAPNDLNEIKGDYKKITLLQKLVLNHRCYNIKSFTGKTKIIHLIEYCISSLIGVNRVKKNIRKILNKLDRKYDGHSALLAFYSLESMDIKKIPIMDNEWFNETVYLPFHDMMMPVPKDYEKELAVKYGDWKKPVKGAASHSAIIIDMEKSYKEVLWSSDSNRQG